MILFFSKVAGLQLAILLKKRLHHGLDFVKLCRTRNLHLLTVKRSRQKTQAAGKKR